MKRIFTAIIVVATSLFGSVLAAEEEFRIIRLGDKAAMFQTGRESTTNTVVLASRRGLVVVDTGVIPTQGAALRAAIEREFGRRDFAYVVNTHSHYDHSDGNQAFADVPIVAHQNALREMTRGYGSPAGREAFIRGRDGYKSQLETALKTAAAGSRDEARIREDLAEENALASDFRNGRFVLTRPTVTFTDRMTLDLGDLTLNLIYFGQAHTESDILIHVPQLDLLLVGDLFMEDWLPGFQGRVNEVPRGFQALDGLPMGDRAVKMVLSGHGESMTGDEFRTRVAYLRDVWDGVTAARREGATLAATKERFPFDKKKYPALAGLTRAVNGQDLHLGNIESAWRLQSDSAAQALESLITARGVEAAVAEYRKTIAGNERYYADENALNALGYRFLQSRRTAEAVAVFEILAETFPESWNAWDSLAEAYLRLEDQDKAEKYYAKSVELNPDNQNGKDNLSEIRGHKLDAAAETKEPVRFQPGAKTGLNKPYFGQTLPGSKPIIFAPGIVSTAASFDFSVTFSPDGREFYYCRRKDGGRNTIMFSRWEKDGWTAPEEADFSKGFPSTEPHITPDGRKLFFGGNRPRPGVEQAEYGIWVVERTAACGWSEPRYHGLGMYVSTARNGNLYMMDFADPAGPGVALYPWADGRFGPPQRLGGGVNSPRGGVHAFIAPDESYILFDSTLRPSAQGGEGDLFVCFRKPDGSWGEAFNLGDEINTPGTNFCPSVSSDGKFIFYATNRDIYWVSAKVLDGLKAKASKAVGAVLKK
jgi:glyoxylase-like metal-dependent hydrolase (beta-lactamase superfamily II)